MRTGEHAIGERANAEPRHRIAEHDTRLEEPWFPSSVCQGAHLAVRTVPRVGATHICQGTRDCRRLALHDTSRRAPACEQNAPMPHAKSPDVGSRGAGGEERDSPAFEALSRCVVDSRKTIGDP